MNDLNTNLIVDLAKLANRYSADDWDALVAYLRDDSRRRDLITLLESVGEAGTRRRPSSRPRQRPPTIARVLDKMTDSDPPAAQLLREFRNKLIVGELLPRTSDLNSFAEHLGMKDVPRYRKREQAINFLVRQLALLSYDELAGAMAAADVRGRDFGKEYEKWVELILRDGPRSS